MVRRSRPGALFRALLPGLSLVALCLALCGGLCGLCGGFTASAQTVPNPHGMGMDNPHGMMNPHEMGVPTSTGPDGTMPMDLHSGKTDSTPLSVHSIDEAFSPMTPPQTVEGTLLKVAPDGASMVVRTKRDGDVAVGLPPDVYISREGKESSIGAMHPGDRVYATVETSNGVRAVRLVSEPPANPLVNYIGIPVLLLIALLIWWTGRKQGNVLAEAPAPAKRPA